MSMTKTKIFIDGREGTTGLKILDRLAGRDDIEMIDIPDELRKDPAARAERLNAADAVILAEAVGASAYNDIYRELELCERLDRPVLGAFVLE